MRKKKQISEIRKNPTELSRSDFIKTAAVAGMGLSMLSYLNCKPSAAKKIRIGFIQGMWSCAIPAVASLN